MTSRMVPFALSAACLLSSTLSIVAVAADAPAAAAPGSAVVALAQCPPPVQQTLTRESKGGELVQIEAVTTPGGPVYLAIAKLGGREYDLEVRGTGTLVMKGLSIVEEGPVTPAALPAPVRATLEREAQGGTIGPTVTKHDPQLAAGGPGGQRLYMGSVTIDGSSYQVEIRDDGVLLAKQLVMTAAPGQKP